MLEVWNAEIYLIVTSQHCTALSSFSIQCSENPEFKSQLLSNQKPEFFGFFWWIKSRSAGFSAQLSDLPQGHIFKGNYHEFTGRFSSYLSDICQINSKYKCLDPIESNDISGMEMIFIFIEYKPFEYRIIIIVYKCRFWNWWSHSRCLRRGAPWLMLKIMSHGINQATMEKLRSGTKLIYFIKDLSGKWLISIALYNCIDKNYWI